MSIYIYVFMISDKLREKISSLSTEDAWRSYWINNEIFSALQKLTRNEVVKWKRYQRNINALNIDSSSKLYIGALWAHYNDAFIKDVFEEITRLNWWKAINIWYYGWLAEKVNLLSPDMLEHQQWVDVLNQIADECNVNINIEDTENTKWELYDILSNSCQNRPSALSTIYYDLRYLLVTNYKFYHELVNEIPENQRSVRWSEKYLLSEFALRILDTKSWITLHIWSDMQKKYDNILNKLIWWEYWYKFFLENQKPTYLYMQKWHLRKRNELLDI